MNEYIIGIDIGSSKVCAAVGKFDKYNKLQIIGITSVKCTGIKKSVVVDIDDTAKAINECIVQLERMVDIEIKDVYISLPGEISELIWNKGVIAISSEDREIKKNDVDRVLQAAKLISVPSDKEIIGVVPQQYIVDGYENIKEPIGMSGLRLEVEAQVIVAKSTIINNLFKSVNRAEVRIKGIVLQPLAISKIVLDREEVEMGTVLVDVGAQNTEMSVFKSENLCGTDMISLGGNNISNDISLCLKIPYSEAEKIKTKYANIVKTNEDYNEKIKVNSAYDSVIEIDYNVLNQIIEARVEEILYFVKQNLIKNNYYDEISEIVIVGGGISFIKGIEEFAREILGKSVRIGSPHYTGANSPLYATCVGIVEDVANSYKHLQSPNTNEHVNDKVNNKVEYDEENNDGFFNKMREFFTDFFYK
ncbi:cell division protein FtsA [Haloimpatiens sp. FM7330]|uniref:cell division protein FtsA n=1 Tax=Haloimpatiens sp. FM7330 TaxID=3298610 RepID=UPI00362A927F